MLQGVFIKRDGSRCDRVGFLAVGLGWAGLVLVVSVPKPQKLCKEVLTMELLTMSRSDAADLYITRAMRLANESAVLEEEAKTTKKLTDEDVITLLGYEVVSPHIAEVLSVAGRDVDQLIGNEEDPHKKVRTGSS